jgi:uncharacterized protein (TIGR02266 family)
MSAGTQFTAKTVVIADDTAFVRERFRQALEGAGHRALTSRTGPQLLDAIRGNRTGVDLVLLDLRLPRGRGISLLHAIGTLDQPPPVVVFSGTIASTDEVRVLDDLGVAGYVSEYAASQHILSALQPHLFPDESERRSSPRAVLGVPVSYRFGNTIAVASALSLSQGGLAVRTTSPLAVDTSLRVRLRLPTGHGEIDAQATVVWTDRRLGMGMRFSDISPAGQAQIDAYVQSNFFSNRKA